MKEMEQLEQAAACLELVKNNQSHSFFKHRLAKLTTELEEAKRDRQSVQQLEASLSKERSEANEALEKLMKRALYHGEVIKLELPHLEVVRDMQTPQNKAQKEAYVDLLLDILGDEEQKGNKEYYVTEAMKELEPLEKAYSKEQSEFLDVNENYYRQLANKDAAFTLLVQRVREVKRFARAVFGLRSREYQSIKDSTFTRKRNKAADTQPEIESPVATS